MKTADLQKYRREEYRIMMGKSHFIISTGLTVSIITMAGVPVTSAAVVAAAVSSLLPDIDEPNSILVSKTLSEPILRILQTIMLGAVVWILWKGLFGMPWDLGIAVAVVFVAFLPLRSLRKVVMCLIGVGIMIYGREISPWNYMGGSLLIICTFLPHRGLTHTVYGTAAWTALLYGTTAHTGNSIWFAGGVSYLLHLLADSLTNRGVRLLPPLKWRLRFNLMSTGTRKGSAVENVCILLTIIITGLVFLPKLTGG